MTNDRKTLNFLPTLGILAVLSLAATVPLFLLSQSNQARQQQMVQKYTQELQPWMEKNQAGLETIFTESFPGACETHGKDAESCPSIERSKIASLLSDDLSDFSSTAFIQLSPNERITGLKLSGDIFDIGYEPNGEVVRQLLKGERDSIPWDDYTYSYAGKEIIVPFRDQNQQIIGGVMRRVIEK